MSDTALQVIRWSGLAAVITAVVAGVLQLPGASYVVPWLFLLGLGCWVVLTVVHVQRQRRAKQQRQAGTDSSR